jgi:hypothetical protein
MNEERPTSSGSSRRATEPNDTREVRAETRRTTESGDAHAVSQPVTLFHDEETRGFKSRWDAIQTGFVDEPRTAVEQADALVGQVVARLGQVFGEQRTQLEHQWDRGDEVSTEDLRMALKRYRTFFDRLLSV